MTKILVDKETGEEFAVEDTWEIPIEGTLGAYLRPIPKPAKSLEEEVNNAISVGVLDWHEFRRDILGPLCRVLERRFAEGKKD